MTAANASQIFSESDWDAQEHNWKGKSFYFIPYISLLMKITGPGRKIEQIRFESRKNGYKMLNNIILFEYTPFKGKVMVEIEKHDEYDAQVLTFEDDTSIDTLVHRGPISSVGKVVKRLAERVSGKRSRPPRSTYFWLVTGVGSERSVVFAIT